MSPGAPSATPCPGPSGMLSGQPVDPAVISGAVERGTVLYGQLIAKFLGAVQAAAAEGVGTVTGLLNKFDNAVSSGQAAGQSVIDGLAANFKMAALSQAVLPAGGPLGGGDTSQGAVPGQYNYDLYQYADAPWGIDILPGGQKPADSSHPNCFVAGFDDVFRAIDYVRSHQGSVPPGFCPQREGFAAPVGGSKPPVGTECSLYQVYRLWDHSVTPEKLVGCTVRCSTDPAPPGGEPFGNPLPYQIAIDAMNTAACPGGGGITPPAGEPTYMAGCDSNGKPVVWDSSTQAPSGVTKVVGPFMNQQSASAAASALCTGSPSGGNGGTQPAPCCDIKLPDCIQIDLCDWEKFKNALVDALCEWYERCVCKLDNEMAYGVADCDPKFPAAMNAWSGAIGGVFTTPPTLDEIVGQGADKALGVGAGPDFTVFPW